MVSGSCPCLGFPKLRPDDRAPSSSRINLYNSALWKSQIVSALVNDGYDDGDDDDDDDDDMTVVMATITQNPLLLALAY